MSLRRAEHRIASRLAGGRAGTDLDEEIRNHVLERAELLVAEGWSRDDALREAERRFGDRERILRELTAIERGGSGQPPRWPAPRGREVARSLAADARYALRTLLNAPTFTASVVATLALGIGATASVFAVVDALLLRPMPYSDPDRWVEVNQARTEGSGYTPGLSAARVDDWQEAAHVLFDAWVMYDLTTLVRTDGERAEPLSVVGVSPGAARLLGIPLLLGRGLTADDGRQGAPQVALISEAFWRRSGEDPAVLGRTLRLESGPVTVVGVVSSAVLFPPGDSRPDLWLPMHDDFTYADRSPSYVQGLWARLPEGVEVTAAQDRADVLAAGLMERVPEERTWRVTLVPIGDYRGNPDVRRALWTLSGTVVMIFLIALVNGGNLVLVRASARTREAAVRLAMGASRARLLRQFLAEALTLGVVSGAVAVGLAWGAVRAVREILPGDMLFWSPHVFEVEGRTLTMALGGSLLAGVVLGMLPALQVLRVGVPLVSGSRSGGDPPGLRRFRRVLVVGQVALSMTLLAGAGLFVNGFIRLVREDPGFDYERVALADLMASPTRYPDGPARWELATRLEGALEARPEIAEVSFTTGGGFSFGVELEADGRPLREDQPMLLPRDLVRADYFSTMGVEIEAGRPFDESDAGTDNVIVDRDMARFLFGESPAVGRRFRVDEEGPWLTIVGVVEELRLMGRDERRGPYQILHASQPGESYGYLEFAMRTAGRPEALLPVFEQALRSVDPEQAYWRLRTAAQALAEEEETPRFLVTLMSLLAGIAVTLAAVGLYGVLAYAVTRRHREIGIRMALGAARRRVRTMMLREGMALAAAGVVLGLLGSFGFGRAIESLLYEVTPTDASTLVVTSALLLGIAALASLLPARRATRVDPVEALRAE